MPVVDPNAASKPVPLTEQPMFWVALAEAGAIIVLIAILVISMAG